MGEVKWCLLCQRLVQPERLGQDSAGCILLLLCFVLALPTLGLSLLGYLLWGLSAKERCPICQSTQLRKPVS